MIQRVKRNMKLNLRTYFVFSFFLTIFIFYPGLSGDFMFDDEMNFIKLNVFHSYSGFESIRNYILANETGFLKRPISTLSFLLSATNWPADPYYFKLTNLVLHLIIGFLLFHVILKMIKLLYPDDDINKTIALISFLMWVTHPLWVSTVLYANQRLSLIHI